MDKTKDKKPFDFTITEELRVDYDKFLRGQLKVIDVRNKYGITQYQINKLFDIMYYEKRKHSTFIRT